MNVIEETVRGTEAFVEAATRPHPERVAAIIAHDTAVVSRLCGWKKVGAVAEGLMYPLLAGAALRTQDKAGAVALIGAGISEREKSADPHTASWLGIAGGVAQYAGYAWALRNRGARPGTVGLVARAGLVAAGAILRPNKAATITVGTPMVYATELANDRRLKTSTAAEGISHGGNLLVAAEAATALGWRTPAMSLAFIGNLMLIDGLTH